MVANDKIHDLGLSSFFLINFIVKCNAIIEKSIKHKYSLIEN